LKNALMKLTSGLPLDREEAARAMTVIMDGEATPAQIGALLAALRVKGETVEEITGFARVMRERSLRVHTDRRPLLDTCGTGGDTVKTFNISTAAAFVAAAAGAGVAKHGNRSVTSKCGSADVLESLVHGRAGLDEIATFGETLAAEYRNGILKTFTLTPEMLGLSTASPEAVAPGHDAAENAVLLRGVLSGRDRGPRRDIVLANAAAALYVAGIVDTLPAGVIKAASTIDSGAADATLESLIACTLREAPEDQPIK
jgi:anthranilate phosphoribosyltransferase